MNALFFATFLCMGALASASWGHGVALWSPHHGAAPIGHNGQVVDTPEVAHAKAAHFAAKAAATHGAHGVYGGLAHGYGVPAVYGAHGVPSVYGAHGVYAHGLAPLSHDGVVVDTPEVAHAKIAHASAVARLSHGIAHGGPVYGGLAHGVYGAGYGVPAVYGAHGAWAHGAAPIGHNGQVVDTPEVAHAKAAHFSAVAAATHGAHGVYGAHAYGAPSVYGHGAWAHGGAPIGHNGQVVDTPEVAHAKAAHFAAKAAATHGAHHYGAHGLW